MIINEFNQAEWYWSRLYEHTDVAIYLTGIDLNEAIDSNWTSLCPWQCRSKQVASGSSPTRLLTCNLPGELFEQLEPLGPVPCLQCNEKKRSQCTISHHLKSHTYYYIT